MSLHRGRRDLQWRQRQLELVSSVLIWILPQSPPSELRVTCPRCECRAPLPLLPLEALRESPEPSRCNTPTLASSRNPQAPHPIDLMKASTRQTSEANGFRQYRVQKIDLRRYRNSTGWCQAFSKPTRAGSRASASKASWVVCGESPKRQGSFDFRFASQGTKGSL